MSKHIFEQTFDGQTYRVQIGWDKPLQRFYGVISPWVEDTTCEEGGYFDDCDPVWSNLYLSHNVGLDDIVDACTQQGLTLPDGLIENVITDQQRNAVNEITIYQDSEIRPLYNPNPDP